MSAFPPPLRSSCAELRRAGNRTFAWSIINAVSPMISAASALASIASRSGAIDTASAVTPKRRRSMTVASATEVLELLSIAIVRMSCGSRRV